MREITQHAAIVTCPPPNRSNSRVRVSESEKGEIWLAGSTHLSRSSASCVRVEVALAQGSSVALAARGIGVTDQTYYRWRREYGGLTVEQAKRLKELEKENLRLRRAVSDLTLDKLILKEAAEGNF